MSRAAMMNIITRETPKTAVLDAYKDYQDTQPKGFESFHASRVEPIACEIPDGSKVLDIGCNSGEFMALLEKKGCDVYGVDVADAVLEKAKERGLKVQKADAEALPFEDGSFDVVVCMEVLVHLHDPVKALKEFRRVLKPSGFILGSAPHANLESRMWEEKKLHHRYYDEARLTDDLAQAFEKTHLKVLTGAQFSVGMAMSHMAEEPAEMLWKSGNADTPEWEHALTSDNKTLRVWMGPTQPPGDAYYRMIGFAEKMRKMEGTEVGFENFSWSSNDGCSDWQSKMMMNDEFEPVSKIAVDQFQKLLQVANPWVFQVTYHEEILTLFEVLKDLYPSKKLITECDDWIFDVPAYNVASNPYRPGSEKERIADEQMKLSDAVIVSTSFLKENLEKLYPNKPIHVVPNAIDFDLWDNVKSDGKMAPKKDGVVRLGYTGCGNHSGDLEIVKPVLLALLDEFPNLEVIISAEFDCFKDVKHPRFIVPGRWVSIMDYPAMVKGWDLDIGIAPLRDNNFNRAKSNLRWLEYSALKIPTVASNVRPFAECVTQRSDALLCATKADWYGSLRSLIEGPSARQTLAQNAYDSVKERFNMDTVAKQYRAILEDIKR